MTHARTSRARNAPWRRRTIMVERLEAVYFGFSSLQQSAPWLALTALIVYIACFAIGLGPVFWLMISEIFPQNLRSRGMSASTVVNWMSNFLISATFLSLVGAITRTGTFALYTLLGVIAVIFFAWRVPETKGRSLEDIQRSLTSEAGPVPEPAGRSVR